MADFNPPRRLLSCAEWLSALERDRVAREILRPIYADNGGRLEERKRTLRRMLSRYTERFGNGPVAIARSPGRINLMGRHVDHRGGHVNPIGIDREVFVVAGLRKDRSVHAVDMEEGLYPPREAAIDSLLPAERRGQWTRFIDETRVKKGDWQNYVVAPVLWLWDKAEAKGPPEKRVQWEGEPEVKGMNLVLCGDIPPSAGLSSSSAVVVASMLASASLNRVSADKADLAAACGEAEWYVGTRGGSGDHAAEILSNVGEVSHIGFFPSSVGYLPFPSGFRVLVANSRKEAHKSAGARSIFNQATATYDFGFALLKRRWPEHARSLSRLRDVNGDSLGCDVMEIYRMIRSLPETCTRKELRRLLDDEEGTALLERRCKDHEDPGEFGYAIRRKMTFGITECERSRLCAHMLQDGDLDGFGELMSISHNGDRVFLHRPGTVDVIKYWDNRVSDEYLDRLIEDAASGDPVRVRRSALHRQYGDYGCGCEEIDQLVDIALGVPGVVGAQLSGAGLGGSMMALVAEESCGAVQEAQTRLYYDPRGLDPLITVCAPIAGASVLSV